MVDEPGKLRVGRTWQASVQVKYTIFSFVISSRYRLCIVISTSTLTLVQLFMLTCMVHSHDCIVQKLRVTGHISKSGLTTKS